MATYKIGGHFCNYCCDFVDFLTNRLTCLYIILMPSYLEANLALVDGYDDLARLQNGSAQNKFSQDWKALVEEGLNPDCVAVSYDGAWPFIASDPRSANVLKFWSNLYSQIPISGNFDRYTAIFTAKQSMAKTTDGTLVGANVRPRAFLFQNISRSDINYGQSDLSDFFSTRIVINAPHEIIGTAHNLVGTEADELLLVGRSIEGALTSSEYSIVAARDNIQDLVNLAEVYVDACTAGKVLSPGSPHSVFASRVAMWAEMQERQ